MKIEQIQHCIKKVVDCMTSSDEAIRNFRRRQYLDCLSEAWSIINNTRKQEMKRTLRGLETAVFFGDEDDWRSALCDAIAMLQDHEKIAKESLDAISRDGTVLRKKDGSFAGVWDGEKIVMSGIVSANGNVEL